MAQHDQPPRRVAHTSKPNTFFGGAAILAVGILVVKLIGMFYKIPLLNIIGEQGSADFNNAYNIYSVLLTISTAGLPVAVSKLVSEADALGRRNQVRRTFRLALALFLILGVLSFLVMFFGSEQLAGLMNDSMAAPGIRALAPAVICVGCLSAFRGYAQGHGNMTPTAVSQIIEALCKLTVGLGLAYWLVGHGADASHAAAGAITGVTVGTIVALAYMLMNFLITRSQEPQLADDRPDEPATILKHLLMIAVPITISSSMVGIVTVIDTSLVQGQLQRALLENQDTWNLYGNFVDFTSLEDALSAWQAALPDGSTVSMSLLDQYAAQAEALRDQQSALTDLQSASLELHAALENISRTLYGNYSGALNIYNLPTSLMAAVTAAVIPAVSGALARRDRRGAGRITGSALRISALAACPMAVGLFVLGEPIMALIFPNLNPQLAGPLLSTLGLATLFVCMMLVCNSILQAHGFVSLPVIIMVAGGVVKIITNYNVVIQPTIGIYGAPMGNILCFALCMTLDLVVMSRVIPRRPKYIQVFAKPLAASALMGLGAWAVHGLMSKLFEATGIFMSADPVTHEVLGLSRTGNAAATLLAILVAVVIYGVLVIALRAITKDDLMLMPKGEKIARMLRL
ncbi:oligosaccharide flippase family protein [Pseudoflavonifractor capillosus]|uniref:oligosaccharide flippase family protein n=1 Tax=Pseudoflavonifractor capillosus TaxID=106588 RepID=UPI00195D2049|nr:oligosaccharide flippase family protein [Pseudoflavonifractor capillosus]MBM6681481.1 polysaccharide biosynthesis protein [Pseudoflavonifractor capillosus]